MIGAARGGPGVARVELPSGRVVEVRAYPTELPKLPAWCLGITARLAAPGVAVSDVSVAHLSPEFRPRGLLQSLYMPDVDSLDSSSVAQRIFQEVRPDGAEVVEWMILSAAENAVMQSRIAEYNRLGSQLLGRSDDPYIPGLVVEDAVFERATGSAVSSRGYAVVSTPRGNFSVPSMGKATGVFRDYLAWGSISFVGSIQYVASLLKWRSLARTPIDQSVGFFMDSRGNQAPNFFVQVPHRPAAVVPVKMRLSSSSGQTVAITLRDTSDFTRVVGQLRVSVPPGESEVRFRVMGIPPVPPLVVEIQPEDGVQTVLEEYTVGWA